MPHEEIPFEEQAHEPSDRSSISSGSSGRLSRVYSFSSQNNNSDSDGGSVRSRDQIIIENRLNRDEIRRRIETNRDSVEFNGPVEYMPIVVPAEPSLDELLRQVSGTQFLHTVTDIKLRVISHMLSLQRIPMFCPNLRALNLEGSVVMSLRDLGTDMRTLIHLNVSRCGLKSLDGTNGLLNLEELVADNNEISDTGPCTNLPKIKKLSLKGNNIVRVASISFLALCDTLTMLNLNDNAVTSVKDYRIAVKRNVPQLAVLDGIAYEQDSEQGNNSLSSSEYKSSSSDSGERQKFNWKPEDQMTPPIEWVNNNRPGTAFSGKNNDRLDKNRPATADQTKRSRLPGEPMVGNILQHARRNRKIRQAWVDSASSISSSELSEMHKSDFPRRIEQDPIDLELGLIGSEPSVELSDENVLEAARIWRRRSAQNRERIRTADKARTLDQIYDDN